MYKEVLKKHQEWEKENENISRDEALQMMKELVLAKMEKCDIIDEDMLEQIAKGAFTRGLSVLGTLGILATGAQNMGQKPVQVKQTSPQEMKQIQQDAYDEAKQEANEIIERNKVGHREDTVNNFLHNISGVESSFGRNTKHKTMNSGIHEGTSAYGNYGLMPNTIAELANRMDSDHPLKNYKKMSPQQIKQSLDKNPDHQHEFAKFMAGHLYDKFGGDEEKMAYSWNQGHNLENSAFEKGRHAKYKQKEYVQKYNNFKSKQKKQPVKPESSVASND